MKITSVLVSFTLASALAACVEAPPSPSEPALLYGLTSADVEALHAQYLADEPIAATYARLTAPFACDGFGDLCRQVGAEAAEAIIGDEVALALAGTPRAEVDAALQVRLAAATAAHFARPERVTHTTTQTTGDFRLRVENGVTNPLVGSREAWTHAWTQHQNTGIWWSADATQLCVDAGTNTQALSGVQFEAINPANSCALGTGSRTVTTLHARINTLDDTAIIIARGCGTAQLNGLPFSACDLPAARGF